MTEEAKIEGLRTSTAVTVLAVVVAVALGLWVLGALLDIVLLCFAGGLIGVFLRASGAWMSRLFGAPKRLMVVAVCVIGGALVSVAAWIAAPFVATQTDQLLAALPGALQRVTDPMERFSWGRSVLEGLRDPGEILSRGDAWAGAGGIVATTLGGVGSFLVIVFVGLFTGFDPDPYVRGVLRLVPTHRRARAGELIALSSHTLRLWMIGKLLSMAVVGITTGVGLAMLKVPLAFVLALLAAILTFIPNFGPVLSAAPAILLALLQGPMKAVWVIGLYVGIQTVESYLLTPLMQKKMVSLPPALTLVVQVAMGMLAGGLGLLVATPITAVALALANEVLGSEGITKRES